MWYVEKYQPDGKQPYLLAQVADFAVLRTMITNRPRDRIEILAPTDASPTDIETLMSLGTVQIRERRSTR
jgi:hypothetical protein